MLKHKTLVQKKKYNPFGYIALKDIWKSIIYMMQDALKQFWMGP